MCDGTGGGGSTGKGAAPEHQDGDQEPWQEAENALQVERVVDLESAEGMTSSSSRPVLCRLGVKLPVEPPVEEPKLDGLSGTAVASPYGSVSSK